MMTTEIHQGIIHVPAGEGQTVAIGPGSTTLKLTSVDPGNTMAVWEGIVPAGFGSPPLHAIPQAETFYLREGALRFTGINQDGPYSFQSRPGAVVHIPGGAPYQFVNGGARPARVLTIAMPGGLEQFLAEFATALPAALDARYGAGYLHTGDPATLDRSRPIVHVPAEAGTKVSVGRATNTIKLTSTDTAGALSLIEGRFPPGTGSPPLHTHPEAETFVLFEGDVAFTTVNTGSPRTFTLRPGDVVHVAPRTPHQFTIIGPADARGIVAVTPGGFERYIAEMGTATRPDGSRDVERLREIAARYGVEYVRLPGR
jgi:quercetin dioxygenase-like cupin family protein